MEVDLLQDTLPDQDEIEEVPAAQPAPATPRPDKSKEALGAQKVPRELSDGSKFGLSPTRQREKEILEQVVASGKFPGRGAVCSHFLLTCLGGRCDVHFSYVAYMLQLCCNFVDIVLQLCCNFVCLAYMVQ
jgi:hypothetical protein